MGHPKHCCPFISFCDTSNLYNSDWWLVPWHKNLSWGYRNEGELLQCCCIFVVSLVFLNFKAVGSSKTSCEFTTICHHPLRSRPNASVKDRNGWIGSVCAFEIMLPGTGWFKWRCKKFSLDSSIEWNHDDTLFSKRAWFFCRSTDDIDTVRGTGEREREMILRI